MTAKDTVVTVKAVPYSYLRIASRADVASYT